MKTTPQVTTNTNTAAANNEAAKGSAGKFTITPNEPVALSELIAQAKQKENVTDTVQEPTTYATPEPKAESQPAPTPAEKPAEPKATTPQPAAEPAAPVAVPPATPARSRSEEIDFQVAKSAKLQLINTQLQSLKGKAAELGQFSYAVDQDQDHRYGRISIFDDNNKEFVCRNHGVAALIVEFLKDVFGSKIDEKENELLTVSRS